jgi:hypothetical protein
MMRAMTMLPLPYNNAAELNFTVALAQGADPCQVLVHGFVACEGW